MTVALSFLDDEQLVHEITSAELVVLPYWEMHNSGATLTALSLDRPVLVPDNEPNRRLSNEVGPGWVFRYAPPLTGEHLLTALEEVRAAARSAEPDLRQRDWQLAGQAHLAAYHRAVAAVRG
jgi:beta-1,4-mannosyltransferase